MTQLAENAMEREFPTAPSQTLLFHAPGVTQGMAIAKNVMELEPITERENYATNVKLARG